MKEEEENKMDNLFSRLNGQWDTDEPALGHHHRFMQRLETKSEPAKALPKKGYLIKFAPVAAAIAMIFGLFTLFNSANGDAAALANMSPKNKEAQEYFSMVIKKELAEVEKENTPETKKLVTNALQRMDALEKDYNSLALELQQKGESKKIIHAMITNLQTRISFLEEVLAQIENIKKIKENYHENNL